MPFWRRDVDAVIDVAIDGASTFIVRQNRRYRDLVEVATREMVHTRICLDHPRRSGFPYTDAMHVALGLCRERRRPRVLCLGGGGGIVATQLALGGAVVDLVERSELVIGLAEKHFGLRTGASLALHHADAACFLAATKSERYDVVLVDLFGAFEASALLADRTFFEDVARALRDGGSVAVNTIGVLDGDAGAMLATERAMAAVFPELLAVPLLAERERATRTTSLDSPRNIVLFASLDPFPARVLVDGSHEELPTFHLAVDDVNRRLRAIDAARTQARRGRAIELPSCHPRGRLGPTSATSSARFAAPTRV